MAASIIKAIQRISNYACVAGMFSLLIMMLLTTCDVIGRNFLKAPIIGSFELTEFMLVVVVLLAIPYTQQVEGNARITLFVFRLSPRRQLIVDSIMTLLSLTFFLIISWGALKETLHSYHAGGVSDILRIPKWPFKFLVAIGIFILSLELLIRLITSLGKLINKGPSRRTQNEPN